MAKNAATHHPPAHSSASQPVDSRPALAPVIEINVRHIGRTPQPEKLTGSEAPEGWIKKIDRPREGKWGFRRRRTLIPEGTRTAFRAEGEQLSERSDAGTSIVQEVFGLVKGNLSGA